MLQATKLNLTRQLPASKSPTQRVGAFSGLPALIRELGSDPAPMIAAAGLSPDALDHCDGRVEYASLVQLLQLAARDTKCAHLGLLAGRMWQLSDLGLVGELARNCVTVGEALETLTVYQHLNSGGGMAFLIENGATVDVGYAIYHFHVSGTDQMYDCVMSASINYLRELCGPLWSPSEVLLPHSMAVDIGPYRRIAKAPVRSDAEFSAIRFPRHWLKRPVPGSDATRYRLAIHQANQMDAGELIERVVRAVRTLLLHGKGSGNDVANMLAMHRRTLNRQLKAQGTTFRELLDQVRFDAARQLLGESDISLDDIAATLGYAGVSPFMRTFRRWADTTPDRWRRGADARRTFANAQNARTTRRGNMSVDEASIAA